MGVVYEAVQQSLGRHVALKVLPRSRADAGLERFRLEARAAARLHHTNIVPVFGVGEDAGVHYFAMQYIRGQGLDQVVEELRRLRSAGAAPASVEPTVAARLLGGTFEPPAAAPSTVAPPTSVLPDESSSPSEPSTTTSPTSGSSSLLADEASSGRPDRVYFEGVSRIALQVADALAYAHAQGILHRDIKPSNIMLDTRGTAWVTDFGLAKADEGAGYTRTGDVLGTLRYMAPERFDGRSDPRGDVYALGATLYELLTLRPAFPEVDRPRLIELILRGEPAPPRSVDPRVPRDLEVICLKCLAKEPSRRYAGADALVEDLRRFCDGEPILARRAPAWEVAWKWANRRPAAAVAAVLLVAATATVVSLILGYNARLRVASARAAAGRDLALRALDRLAGEVQETLREVPATRPIRRRLLDTAIAGLREVADGPDSSTPDLRRALAHRKLGELYREVGDAAQARAQYEACILVAERLVAASPHDLEALGCLAVATGGLGEMLLQEDRRVPAKELLARSVELTETWVTLDPTGRAGLDFRLTAYRRLGHFHLWCEEVPPARAAFDKMLGLARERLARSPDDARALEALFDAETFLGRADESSDDSVERGPTFAPPSRRRAG